MGRTASPKSQHYLDERWVLSSVIRNETIANKRVYRF